MRQKFVIARDTGAGKLSIKEYAELDKDVISLLCEETFDEEDVRTAMQSGRSALLGALRTHNMYPPVVYADAIAAAVEAMYAATGKDAEPAELVFDDLDFIAKHRAAAKEADEEEMEEQALDKLLDDDFEENTYTEGKEEIAAIDTPPKVAPPDDSDTQQEDFFLDETT